MTDFTPILQIQEIDPSQNSKEVTINDGFVSLEDATQANNVVAFTSNVATISGTNFVSFFMFEASNQTADATLTIPLQQRNFAVWNTNTAYTITVGGTTGATVTVLPGSADNIYCDGTNCVATGGGGGGGGGGSSSGMLPLVTGDLPGPVPIADPYGQFIGVPL